MRPIPGADRPDDRPDFAGGGFAVENDPGDFVNNAAREKRQADCRAADRGEHVISPVWPARES